MRHYEIEYRVTPTDATDDSAPDWRRWLETPAEGVGSVVIDGLDLGVSYDIRARLVDEVSGAAGEWFRIDSNVVRKDAGVPPAPSQVRATKGDCITWEPELEVLDLRGYRVRHVPCAWDDFATAEPAHEGIVEGPPFLLCRTPKGRRTFLVVAVDWDDNESAATTVIVDRGAVDDQAEFVIRARDEAALTFPGTVAGATAPASELHANALAGTPGDQPMFCAGNEPWIAVDGASPMIPHDGDADMFSPVWAGHGPWIPRDGTLGFFNETSYQWIEYVWEFEVHCGEEGPRSVLTADVEVLAASGEYAMPWRLQYRSKCALPWIPADPFAEMIPSDGSEEFLPTESPRVWRPWPGRLQPLDVGTYEFRLVVPGFSEQAKVTKCAVTISSEARVRHVLGLSIPSNGGTRIPPGEEEWRHVSEVAREPYGAEALRVVPTVDKDKNRGPRLMAFDENGAQVAQTVDVTVRGY